MSIRVGPGFRVVMGTMVLAALCGSNGAAGNAAIETPASSSDVATAAPPLVIDNDFIDRVFGRASGTNGSTNTVADEVGEKAEFALAAPEPTAESLLLRLGEPFIAHLDSASPHQTIMLRFAEEGRRELVRGNYPEALGYFEKALTIYPDRYLPYIYFYLGWVHWLSGDRLNGQKFFAVAAQWLPDSEWTVQIHSLQLAID